MSGRILVTGTAAPGPRPHGHLGESALAGELVARLRA